LQKRHGNIVGRGSFCAVVNKESFDRVAEVKLYLLFALRLLGGLLAFTLHVD
jgi:hypothetical protein